MALLSFPPQPVPNGTIYPPSPVPGQQQYQWSSTYQTWELLGTATTVTAGTYGNALAVGQFTVDATGRITFAQNVPIQTSTTSQPGIVQLTDDTNSNDPTTALTAAQGFKLQNEIGDTTLLNPFYPNLVTAVNAANGVTGVTPGTYGSGTTVGRFTVNPQGRITSASNVSLTVASTSAPGVVTVGANLAVTPLGVLSVPAATTTTAGAVALVNNTTTNDSTKALTAAAGYALQQEVTALQVKQNTTFAGTLNVVTGLMTSVTPEAALLGFAVGAPLISPFPTTNEYFVIVTTPGTYKPPGSTVFIATYVGDWFQSNGSQWVYYPTGIRYATTTAPGVVEIGNNILVTGTGEISVANASTTTKGVVQLVDDTITNDPTKALTAAAGYFLQQQIGGGAVATLQSVTDNGATTTNPITVESSTNPTGENVKIFSNNINITNGRIQVQTGGLPGINIDAVGTPSLTVFGGGSISLGTGTTGYAEKIRLEGSTGKVSINAAISGATLTVGGTILSDTITTTGNYQISRGGVSAGLLSGDLGSSYLPSLRIAGLNYPTSDGTSGQVLTTNGAGTLSWSFSTNYLQQVNIGGTELLLVPTTSNTGFAALSSLGTRTAEIRADGSAYFGPVTANGTVSATAISIPSNAGLPAPSLGLWSPAPNGLMVTADGTLSLRGFASSTVQQLDITGNGAVFTVDSVRLNPRGGVTTAIRFYDNSTTNFIGLKAPSTIAGNVTFTLPATDGAANEVMTTDGAGNLGWLATAKVVAVPGSSGAGGAAGQIAFGGGFFYWFDPTGGQWLRIAGNTF